MTSAEQTKGFCKYCGKEFARTGMLRHLSACKERKSVLDKETGKRQCGYFELLVYAKYNRDYWLVIEMRETAKLSDLDQFIRDIWVECCGHLSSFDIEGVLYESVPEMGDLWEEMECEGMDRQLKKVLSKGMVFHYEYDYGSTTDLNIKVQDYRTGAWKKEAVTLLSRNHPPVILCQKCRKNKAELIDPAAFFSGEGLWCKECLRMEEADPDDGEEMDDNEMEEMFDTYFLPVCNSPRMGVCGYEGSSIYADQFEPDKK